MKTAHKVAIAKAAYAAVHAGRGVLGMSDRCVVRRGGRTFDLDLAQGIDFAIFLLGAFEPATTRALRRIVQPGHVVLDVGANIGAHSIPLAAAVGPQGRVVAIEPTDFAFAKLTRNVSLNPDCASRISLAQCFLGRADDAAAPEAIYSSWPLSGNAAVHDKLQGEAKGTGGARQRRLDSLLAELGVGKVDVVKMDVDGFECDVLSGARELMARDKPTFVMELMPYALVERGASISELLSFFLPLGYRFFDEATQEALPQTEAEIERLAPDGSSRNVVARAIP